MSWTRKKFYNLGALVFIYGETPLSVTFQQLPASNNSYFSNTYIPERSCTTW